MVSLTNTFTTTTAAFDIAFFIMEEINKVAPNHKNK